MAPSLSVSLFLYKERLSRTGARSTAEGNSFAILSKLSDNWNEMRCVKELDVPDNSRATWGILETKYVSSHTAWGTLETFLSAATQHGGRWKLNVLSAATQEGER
jgi:hypothetical protein